MVTCPFLCLNRAKAKVIRFLPHHDFSKKDGDVERDGSICKKKTHRNELIDTLELFIKNILCALIDAIFPSVEINTDSDYFILRAILSTRNDSVDDINDYLISRYHGDERIYYSFDEAVVDINSFHPAKILNTLSVSLVYSSLPTTETWMHDNTVKESRPIKRIVQRYSIEM
ncbi:unnamed protein product [Lactuca virosa]|uniref:ATP-dependent DNA helicase n=1 Tax=Lactuca virosa TaxID=75947 RepID=A0AAU9M1U6_9ASTR|nr:unnamed protein product [Lactuca virosa]